jgi:4'-phosphopantetheinyl transferase
MVFLYYFRDVKELSTDEKVSALARYHLLHQNGFAPERFIIGRQTKGKPYFKDMPSLHFSVSHSGDVFVCAFSDLPVGVDIQEYKNRPDEAERCRKIAQRFFHFDEIDALDADTVSAFYNIWTAKEAYVKYTGDGIDGDFSAFCIFDLDEYLYQTELCSMSLSVCTPDVDDVVIEKIDLNRLFKGDGK